MKLVDILQEIQGKKYDYGCAMLYFNFPEIQNLHSQIQEQDVYVDPEDTTFGLEDEPHCTLLYGLHEEVSLQEVKQTLNNHTFSEVIAHNISLFENEKYDVLKFDIEGESLHEVNQDLKQFPFTSDYPEYHPHMTVGYLKKGMGKKYVELFKNKEYNLTPEYGVYSQPNGDKTKIKIKL